MGFHYNLWSRLKAVDKNRCVKVVQESFDVCSYSNAAVLRPLNNCLFGSCFLGGHNGCNYLSMLGLKLKRVSKRGHGD